MPGNLAFLPGSVGPAELLIIFLVVLIFFGPRRLPEMSRMLGRTMERLRRASQEFRDQVMRIENEAASGPAESEPAAPALPAASGEAAVHPPVGRAGGEGDPPPASPDSMPGSPGDGPAG